MQPIDPKPIPISYTALQNSLSVLVSIFAFVAVLVLASWPHHAPIGNNINSTFITLIGGVALSLVYIYVNKVLFPKGYAEYKSWQKNNIRLAASFMVVPFGLISFIIFLSLNIYNQYNVTAPIESAQTKVINKYQSHNKSGITQYIVSIDTPRGTLNLGDETIYNHLNIGDNLVIKIQKGRLGSYFALKIQSEKNNFNAPL